MKWKLLIQIYASIHLGNKKRSATTTSAAVDVKKRRKATTAGEGWEAVIQACQALASKKTPAVADADDAFGQFVAQRLKAMTEPRKTKCMSEMMQLLLSHTSANFQVNI